MSNDETVLVVGGAGYVGSHTCKALAAAGYKPVVYDNLSRGHEALVKWGPFIKGDLFDTDRLAETISQNGIKTVFHFAAFAYVGESVVDPAQYYRNNVGGTISLLDAMLTSGADAIVFSSTCATYGTPQVVPITEDHPQNPINPYGHSKLMVERILTDYRAAYGMTAAMLRYFNAAGADSDGDVGEAHENETHLIPLAIRAAMQPDKPLRIFGTDYDTPDGTAVRDYIHVADLAEAHIAALEAIRAGSGPLALNLGTGNGVSVREIVDMVADVSGVAVNFEYADRREGDPPILVADAGLAHRTLNWTPRHSSVEEVVRSAWNWHQKNGFGQHIVLTNA